MKKCNNTFKQLTSLFIFLLAGLSFINAQCTADAGVLSADNPQNCVGVGDTVTLVASVDTAATVPDSFETVYVLTSGVGLIIEQINIAPTFNVSVAGDYTIHTLIAELSDTADTNYLDASTITPGVTTGFDVYSLLVPGGGSLCGDLDVAGAKFNITNIDAGTLTASAPSYCIIGATVTASATVNTPPTVPANYETFYVLTSGPGLVLEQADTIPSFTIGTAGVYTIHTVVAEITDAADPNFLDLSIITFGTTTGVDVLNLITQGGGSICGALDVTGASFSVSASPTANDDSRLVGFGSGCLNKIKYGANDLGLGPATTIAVLSGPNHGTLSNNADFSFSYTFTGDTAVISGDTIVYTVSNPCGTDTATIILGISTYSCNGEHPNINPDFGTGCNTDSVFVNVIRNDNEPDGDSIQFNLITQPNNGVAIKWDDSTILYISDPGFSGNDFFFYEGFDNQTPVLSDIEQVTINVLPCDDPPIIVDANGNPVDTLTLILIEDMDSLYCFSAIDSNGDDVEISGLTGSFGGSFTVVDDTCLNVMPDTNYVGCDTLEVTICDTRGFCDTVVWIIKITPVADAPSAIRDTVIVENTGTVIINPLANDFDGDGDSIYVDTIYGWNHGTAVLNTDGTVSYDPDANYIGKDTIHYVIFDTTGLSDTSMIIICIPSGIDAVDDRITATAGVPFNFNYLSNDNEGIGQGTTTTIVRGPTQGKIDLDPNTGVGQYIANPGAVGFDTVCYSLCDINFTSECDTAYIYITIVPSEVFTPSGFSPNGDGINDNFQVRGLTELFPEAELIVFNRWGDEVWRSEGPYQNDWNGVNEFGEGLPDGTYYYLLETNIDGMDNIASYVIINR